MTDPRLTEAHIQQTTLRFTIPGAPRTKKNHGWRTKSGHQMPSRAFTQWNKDAQWSLALIPREQLVYGRRLPLKETVNCSALFYRDAERGDAVGYYQALADALEEAGIVENDSLIVSWDGSRMLKDKENPRIEVRLEVVR